MISTALSSELKATEKNLLVMWLHYTGIKLRRVRFLLLPEPWILCVPCHGKLWLGFHVNNSLCYFHLFCCQQNCHILWADQRVHPSINVQFQGREKVRIASVPIWKSSLERWLFSFLLHQSIPKLPFFSSPRPTLKARPQTGLGALLVLNKNKTQRAVQKGSITSDPSPGSSAFPWKAVLKFPSTAARTRDLPASQRGFGLNTPGWDVNKAEF